MQRGHLRFAPSQGSRGVLRRRNVSLGTLPCSWEARELGLLGRAAKFRVKFQKGRLKEWLPRKNALFRKVDRLPENEAFRAI